MSLPRIPNPAGAVTIPAVPEQVFPDLFITQFSAVAIPCLDQLEIRTRPYNYDTHEIQPDSAETIRNERNLYALAETYPAIGQAIGAVTLACTGLIALRAAQAVLAPLEAALQSATATVASRQATQTAAQAALDAAQQAVENLPAEATEEETAAAQAAIVDAMAALTVATSDLLTAQSAAASATGPRDAALAAVVAIEQQLGKA